MSHLTAQNSGGEEIRYVIFNQDCSSLTVGTNKGCKLFSLLSFENLEQIYEYTKDEVYIVERLFSSSLVVLVCFPSPRKLRVYHFKKGTEICSYNYANTILSVKLNRARLIVCLEEALFIHNIKDMKVLHTIRDTPPNPLGICALTTNYFYNASHIPNVNLNNLSITNNNNNGICYLAYPGSNTFGEVQIFDTINLRAVTMISAHENPVAALAFNNTGSKIATASEKGTVIRVFSTTEGIKLFEFRRGMKRCVTVFSLHFSPDSLFLALSSNTETVHVFKLEIVKNRSSLEENMSNPSSTLSKLNNSPTQGKSNTSNQCPITTSSINMMEAPTHRSSNLLNGVIGSGTLVDYFNKALSTTSNLLPAQMGDMLWQSRDFATAYLPFLAVKNVCAVMNPPSDFQKTSILQENKRLLLIASYTGTLYIYEFDQEIGGDCSFVKSFKFINIHNANDDLEKTTSPLPPPSKYNPTSEPPAQNIHNQTIPSSQGVVNVSSNKQTFSYANILGKNYSSSSSLQPPTTNQ